MRVDIEAAQRNLRNKSISTYDEAYNEIRQAKDEYLIQAVANLGQRLGVKGDSIITNSFSFRSLFPQASNIGDYSSTSHIGLIERRNNVMYLSIVPRKTLRYASDGYQSIENQVTNSGDMLISLTALENPSKVLNGIDFYKESSLTAARANNYVFCGIGCKKVKDSNVDAEFIYEEFDRETGEIVNGLRLCEVGNYTLILTTTVSNQIVTVETYQLDNGVLQDKLNTAYDILYQMNGYNTAKQNSGVSDQSKINRMSVSYWLNIFKTSKYAASHLTASKTLDSAETTNSVKISNMTGGDKIVNRYPGIETVYKWFEYDKRDEDGGGLLNFIKQNYSQQLYASSNDNFKEQIICSLFNGIYNTYPSSAKIYIPIDFEFNYYCNSNDQWKIYGGINDIHVRFVNRDITVNNLSGYYSENQLLANISSGADNKSVLYNYDVEYDKENSDIVYKVSIRKLYTLPYINSDNVWVINDQITNIPANGKDAGNPNMIIVYNFNNGTDKDSYKILAGANKDNILSGLGWSIKSAWIQPIDQINVDDPQVVSKLDLYKVGCRLPLIDSVPENDKEELISFLKYSLIINVSSVQCFDRIDDTVLDKYGEYGVVTTMWTFNEKTCDYDIIENPSFEGNVDGVALDITAMTNLNNLVKWHIQNTEYKHPDRYSHRWMVFDNANVELKNNPEEFRTYIYPVLMNKVSTDYDILNYSNNLNFVIKYNNGVAGAEEEFITSVGHNNLKYLGSTHLEDVTNSLYYTKLGNIVNNYKEYIPNSQIPLLNLGEMLTVDQNTLNRLNIISPNKDGKMFYSYIGTGINDDNKENLYFGSSTFNINLGTETMVENSNRELFNKVKNLYEDFENVTMTGYAYVYNNLTAYQDVKTFHINWEISEFADHTLYKTNYVPVSKMMYEPDRYTNNVQYSNPLQLNNDNLITARYFISPNKGAAKTNISGSMIQTQMRIYDLSAVNYNKTTTNLEASKLWLPVFYNNTWKKSKTTKLIYLCDGLYIPGLLCKLRLTQYLTRMQDVKITSNLKILTYNSKPIFLLTTNRFLSENIITNDGSDELTFAGSARKSYAGYPLEITYYIDSNFVLRMTIIESGNRQTIDNLFKLKLDY